MILAAAARLPQPTAAALLQGSQGTCNPSDCGPLPHSSGSGGSQHSRQAAAAAAAPPQKGVPLAKPVIRAPAPIKAAAKPQNRSLAAQLAAQAASGAANRKPKAVVLGTGCGVAVQRGPFPSLAAIQGAGAMERLQGSM